jgi:hypothetical protein
MFGIRTGTLRWVYMVCLHFFKQMWTLKWFWLFCTQCRLAECFCDGDPGIRFVYISYLNETCCTWSEHPQILCSLLPKYICPYMLCWVLQIIVFEHQQMLVQFSSQIKIDVPDIWLQAKLWLSNATAVVFCCKFFFLHQYHMNEHSRTQVTDFLFNVFAKIKKEWKQILVTNQSFVSNWLWFLDSHCWCRLVSLLHLDCVKCFVF